jgi:thioredoxin-like negative regulator of GroEL
MELNDELVKVKQALGQLRSAQTLLEQIPESEYSDGKKHLQAAITQFRHIQVDLEEKELT